MWIIASMRGGRSANTITLPEKSGIGDDCFLVCYVCVCVCFIREHHIFVSHTHTEREAIEREKGKRKLSIRDCKQTLHMITTMIPVHACYGPCFLYKSSQVG